MKKYLLIFLIILFTTFSKSIVFSQETINWLRVAGDWLLINDDKTTHLFQKRIRPVNWNYSLPSNYSSIISTTDYPKYTSIHFIFTISNMIDNYECIFFIAAEKSEKSLFHNLHAFRIESDDKTFVKSTFIKSSVIDHTQLNRKGNFKIDVLSSSAFTLPASERLFCEIKTRGRDTSLFINGIKVHTHKTDAVIDKGIIGIGVKNAQLRLYDIKIYNDRNLVLHDDFSKDTIKVLKAGIKKVSKDEFDQLKKQQQNKR